MADKGIIFSAAMVRALLDGRKTQTRRLLRRQPKAEAVSARCVAHEKATGRAVFNFFDAAQKPIYAIPVEGGHAGEYRAPYGVGDRLYVREAHFFNHYEYADQRVPKERPADLTDEYLCYRATEDDCEIQNEARWRPSIHMPRWASRLWLEVTEVRVQRLHEISDEDAIGEGLEWTVPGMWSVAPSFPIIGHDPRAVFSQLWNSLHTTEGERWEDNPWIVALSFNVHRGNIDEVAG